MTPKNTIDEKVRTYFEEEKALLDRLKMTKRPVIMFRHRPSGRPTFFAMFLISVLKMIGASLDTEFQLKDK